MSTTVNRYGHASNSGMVIRHYLLLLTLAVILAGCGLGGSASAGDDRIAIRSPKPTFTPTPVNVPVAQAPGDQPTTAPAGDEAGPNTGNNTATAAKAVVNGPLVNLRAGPSTDFDIVATVERGSEYDIMGINPERTWWQICCVDGEQAWIIDDFVDTIGAVDSVPTIGGSQQATAPDSASVSAEAPPVVTAQPTAAPTVAPQPSANFVLQTQEQFPETSNVRIFLYVYAGQTALEGYSLRITKDGMALPVDGVSFGGQPAFTWPFADARQRFQNFKQEYPDVPAAGEWTLLLVDSNGTPAAPPATFTLTENDPEQELYVRYERQ